ncbi:MULTISPECIES: transporter substrate-binding domain-containing protein [unclassified Janthinobacterium]|uniref:transporter substrate-binding domain-containing protein n=1 Tax=unclassified Janthinobacterium TaxID=2610881 RepID=UPI00034CFF91|nr:MULTISPECIES: transporter substrate-binding domain-containing protein [unclassified Janthinobacterium]MEC5163825.1 ABC-type amino acid transport substrate-binding protein [Janthinobacterium sp. CG_S6]
MVRSLCRGDRATSWRGARLVAHTLALWLCQAAALAAPAMADLSAAQRAWVARQAPVRYAPERDYGPFVYLDGDNVVRGLSVDVLALIGEKTGLRFVAAEALPLEVNLDKAKRGAVDMLTSLRPTPERAAFLGFTSAYVAIPAALIRRGDQPAGLALRDMRGRRVALGKGYAVEHFVRARYPQVQWLALASDDAALAALVAGQVDGVVADVASLQFLAQRRGWSQLVVAGHVGFDYPLSFAYRKDLPMLGEVLQQGLRSISAAERRHLLARWLAPALRGTWQNRPTWPMWAVAALLLVGAGLALWRARRGAAGAHGAAN